MTCYSYCIQALCFLLFLSTFFPSPLPGAPPTFCRGATIHHPMIRSRRRFGQSPHNADLSRKLRGRAFRQLVCCRLDLISDSAVYCIRKLALFFGGWPLAFRTFPSKSKPIIEIVWNMCLTIKLLPVVPARLGF